MEKNEVNSRLGKHRVLELFSGIGGWTYALRNLNEAVEEIFPYDISPVANEVYEFNTGICPCKVSIEKITAKKIDQLRCNLWLLSPPCQPFTRNNQSTTRDLTDPRAKPLLHLISLLPKVRHKPRLIAMENVVGFEDSQCCRKWLEALNECSYHALQFILTPLQFGIPNERPRYYCLASLDPLPSYETILKSIPGFNHDIDVPKIGRYLGLPTFEENNGNLKSGENQRGDASPGRENEMFESFIVPDSVLDKPSGWCLDIVSRNSKRSACFTKSYGRYIKGTGSVMFMGSEENPDSLSQAGSKEYPDLTVRASSLKHTEAKKECIEELDEGEENKRKRKQSEMDQVEHDDFLQDPSERSFNEGWQLQFYGKLRFFTPLEIKRLMNFPEDFNFPSNITIRSKYSLLGNSLNICVVQELLRFYFCCVAEPNRFIDEKDNKGEYV